MISQQSAEAFTQFGFKDIDAIAQYIWGNVQKMQAYNQPLKPQASRGIMPQTDKAPGWDRFTPARIAASTKHKGQIVNEWLVRIIFIYINSS